VWNGQARVPKRSLWFAGASIALSIANLFVGWDYGLRYQSSSYVHAVAALSVILWLLLIVLSTWAVRKPTTGRNLLFHVVLFSWLGWYAFPYLGELP